MHCRSPTLWVTLCLGLVPALAGAQAEVLNLSQDLVRLGIDVRNLTPNDPTLDAGPLLTKGVDYATRHGVALVIADQGAYYFLNPVSAQGTVVLRGTNGLTIDFQGSELFLPRTQRRGLVLSDCRNTTLQNFAIDYLQLPFTQLRVISVDAAARRVRFQVPAAWSHPSVFNTDLNPFGSSVYVYFFRNGDMAPGLTRLTVGRPFEGDTFAIVDSATLPWATRDVLSRIQPEDVAVLSVRGNGEVPLTGERCDGLTLRRGRVYSSGIVGVNIQESARTLVERVYVMPKPGTDRLLSTAADGITVTQPEDGTTIRLSRVIRAADDGLSPHSLVYGSVRDRVAARTLRVERQHSIGFPDGATVVFQRHTDGVALGSAVIVSQTPPFSATPRAQESVEVRFDRDLPELPAGTVFYSSDAVERGSHTLLEKNTVQEGVFARGISLWGLMDSQVRGNYVGNSHMAAIIAMHKLVADDWMSPPLQNVTISNNVIDGAIRYGWGAPARMGAIQTLGAQSNNQEMRAAPHRDVQITNNFIGDSARSAIRVESMTGATVTGNTLVNASANPYLDGYSYDVLASYRTEFATALLVKSSSGVTSASNTVTSQVQRFVVSDANARRLAAYAPASRIFLRARNIGSLAAGVATITDADGQVLALPIQTISADVLAADVPAATSLGGAVIAVGAARGTLFIDSEDALPLTN